LNDSNDKEGDYYMTKLDNNSLDQIRFWVYFVEDLLMEEKKLLNMDKQINKHTSIEY
jgi:hypothetical protein